MPLRHSTETALLIILGLVIAVTGFLIATLPPLPGGILPWAVLMALSVAYPILLTPFFRARRADTPLRWMHWFPAAMLLVWFLIEAATLYLPILSTTQAVYTVLWTLPAVALGILTLVLYCLNVIRRRVPRISALLLTFIAFVALGVTSVRGGEWDKQLASTFWNADIWSMLGTGSILSGSGSSAGEIAASAEPSEERWRQKLRALQRRGEREAARRSQEAMEGSSSSAPRSARSSSSSSGPLWRSASSAPAALPSSGPVVEILALTLLALYTGVLHDRVRRRNVC